MSRPGHNPRYDSGIDRLVATYRAAASPNPKGPSMTREAHTGANENDRYEVNVAEDEDRNGSWHVERIDIGGDGSIEQTIFAGPNAEARARALAARLAITQEREAIITEIIAAMRRTSANVVYPIEPEDGDEPGEHLDMFSGYLSPRHVGTLADALVGRVVTTPEREAVARPATLNEQTAKALKDGRDTFTAACAIIDRQWPGAPDDEPIEITLTVRQIRAAMTALQHGEG